MQPTWNNDYLGTFGLIKQMLSLKIGSLRSRQADLEVPDSSLNASIRSLITSFLICWFITGYRVIITMYNDRLI